MVLFFKTTTADLYDVNRLVVSPIVTRPAALQLHNNNKEFVWGGWVGWVGSYQFSCSFPTHVEATTHVEVELGCNNISRLYQNSNIPLIQ